MLFLSRNNRTHFRYKISETPLQGVGKHRGHLKYGGRRCNEAIQGRLLVLKKGRVIKLVESTTVRVVLTMATKVTLQYYTLSQNKACHILTIWKI
jgi:hypothetical protein